MITEPGVYDLTDEEYHGDPVPGCSLSSTGARKLLPPSCPALYRYWADNPEDHKHAWDIGHAAHLMVLGAGPELAVIDAKDYKTKAAQEAKKAAYAAGKVPVLVAEHATVTAMAVALRAHPFAGALFDPARGKPEQSLFWVDDTTSVWCRARLDWLPDPRAGRALLVDYKTTGCASPDAIAKTVANYGYHQQAAWYLDGARILGLADAAAAFLFVFQEKTAPYLVTVIELDSHAIHIGRDTNRRATEIFRDCQNAGVWPAYTSDVEQVRLPRWAEMQWAESQIGDS